MSPNSNLNSAEEVVPIRRQNTRESERLEASTTPQPAREMRYAVAREVEIELQGCGGDCKACEEVFEG